MNDTMAKKPNKTEEAQLVKNNGLITLNYKCLIVFACFGILIFFEIKSNGSYFDEVLGLLSILIVLYKWNKLYYNDLRAIMLLFLTIAIGLFSNLYYDLAYSWFSVGVDVLTQMKSLFCFFAIRYFLTEREKQLLINMLSPLGKLFLIASFIFAIYSQVFDTPYATFVRYGLKQFKFFFYHAHQYTSIAFLAFGAIQCSTNTTEKSKNFYKVIGLIAISLALKSPALTFSLSYIFLSYYFQHYKKVTLKIIIPLAAAIIVASTYQINTYILNEKAARRVFIDYSFVTANDCFPFGSGFATFGSAEAAKHYSKLYVKYKFYEYWGMGVGDAGMFLYDTYWPMALGQFGYFGGAIFVSIYVNVFKTLNRSKMDYSKRALLYALFIQFMVHALGAPILACSQGLIAFMGLSLFTFPDPVREEMKWNTKLKFIIR